MFGTCLSGRLRAENLTLRYPRVPLNLAGLAYAVCCQLLEITTASGVAYSRKSRALELDRRWTARFSIVGIIGGFIGRLYRR